MQSRFCILVTPKPGAAQLEPELYDDREEAVTRALALDNGFNAGVSLHKRVGDSWVRVELRS